MIKRSVGEGFGMGKNQFQHPVCLAVDTSDNIYVADGHNQEVSVRLFDPMLLVTGTVKLPFKPSQASNLVRIIDEENNLMYVSESESGKLYVIQANDK